MCARPNHFLGSLSLCCASQPWPPELSPAWPRLPPWRIQFLGLFWKSGFHKWLVLQGPFPFSYLVHLCTSRCLFLYFSNFHLSNLGWRARRLSDVRHMLAARCLPDVCMTCPTSAQHLPDVCLTSARRLADVCRFNHMGKMSRHLIFHTFKLWQWDWRCFFRKTEGPKEDVKLSISRH